VWLGRLAPGRCWSVSLLREYGGKGFHSKDAKEEEVSRRSRRDGIFLNSSFGFFAFLYV
jgi:hypothetical protein